MAHIVRNRKALAGVLKVLVTEPDKHAQSVWAMVPAPRGGGEEFRGKSLASCGSAACVSGLASLQAGDLIESWANVWDPETDERVPGFIQVTSVRTLQGHTVGMQDRGQEVLGLDDATSYCLFQQNNKREHLIVAIQRLIEGVSAKRVRHYLALHNDQLSVNS